MNKNLLLYKKEYAQETLFSEICMMPERLYTLDELVELVRPPWITIGISDKESSYRGIYAGKNSNPDEHIIKFSIKKLLEEFSVQDIYKFPSLALCIVELNINEISGEILNKTCFVGSKRDESTAEIAFRVNDLHMTTLQ
jgi:hypothetical protein